MDSSDSEAEDYSDEDTTDDDKLAQPLHELRTKGNMRKVCSKYFIAICSVVVEIS